MKRTIALFAAASLLPLAGCNRSSSSTSSGAPSPSAPPAAPSGAAEPLVLAPAPSSAPAGKIKWMQGPEGLTDVTDAVKQAYAKEHAAGRDLLVYVGATWCEPCQRFHHAVEHGDLDAAFPRLSILGFDADKDGEALANAGYFSRLIPLLAVPNPDGKASGRQIEGSVKGDGALGDLTPRLKQLLAGGR